MMIAKNINENETCQRFLDDYFAKFPNARLQAETNHVLKKLLANQTSMPGKPGGWAAGIIYAVANQDKRACGIPGLLNQECEEFFQVSMGTIYRRAAKTRKLLSI